MSIIGEFTRTQTGFNGHLQTLSLAADLTLVALDDAADSAPAYRVHLGDADGPDVGAGWNRTGERAGRYVALLLDDPVFARPIRANLFQAGADSSAWLLVWTRATRHHTEG